MHYAPAVIVHGGAGRRDPAQEEAQRQGVRAAAALAWEHLRQGSSALDAVELAVRLMEENPVFNCGVGSVLNWFGEVETDASVMVSSGDAGAVGALQGVRHPISVARRVMEETDHLLLCGRGAQLFARALGYGPEALETEERRRAWERRRQAILEGEPSERAPDDETWRRLRAFHRRYRLGPWLAQEPGRPPARAEAAGGQAGAAAGGSLSGGSETSPPQPAGGEAGTVGVVALDQQGCISAGTSTGGIMLKLPGRVGDSAIIGAGTYATPAGGASATGHGEAIMRLMLALRVVELQQQHVPAPNAAPLALQAARQAHGQCGVICVDRQGRLGRAFTTERMYTAGYTNLGELPPERSAEGYVAAVRGG